MQQRLPDLSLSSLSSLLVSFTLALTLGCGDIAVTELPTDKPAGFPDDPIAHYTFEGTIDDDSGLGKHFETYPEGAFVADRAGLADAAYDLSVEDADGLAPMLRAPHIGFTRDFTIALWIKGVPRTGSFWRLAGQGDWFNLGFRPNGEVSFGIESGAVADIASADDKWTFYAGMVRFDPEAAASTVSLYRSGVEVASTVVDGIAYNNPGGCAFYVGMPPSSGGSCSGKGPGFPMPIQVDDLRIFDRALTLEEIKLLAAEEVVN